MQTSNSAELKVVMITIPRSHAVFPGALGAVASVPMLKNSCALHTAMPPGNKQGCTVCRQIIQHVYAMLQQESWPQGGREINVYCRMLG